MTILLPADLIFVHSTTALGWAIRWFERSRGEESSWTNHTAGIGLSNNVVEAQTHVISTPFDEWKVGKQYQIWRTSDLDNTGRIVVASYAESQVGKDYGYLKLVPHALDGLIGKVTGGSPYIFRRVLFLKDYNICSWLWSFSYHEKGLDFGADPRWVAPDDQLDYVNTYTLKWNMVTSG